MSNIKIFSYALFILVFSYSIKSDTTLNTFNSNNITYECIALSFKEDWKCIEQKSKQSISFSSISKKLPANILTKIKFEEPNGMTELNLFIDKKVITLNAINSLEDVSVNVDYSEEIDPKPYGVLKKIDLEYGTTYIGEWKQNDNGDFIKYGDGIQTSDSGHIFEGKFEDEYAIGEAKLKNGDIYVGEINALTFVLDGKGKYTFLDGETFEGDFKNDAAYGDVVHKDKSGRIYKGSVIKWLWNGYGELSASDGSLYKGSFKDGILNGYGVYTFSDENEFFSKYQGEYKDGLENGQGIFFDKKGRMTYSGELKDGIKHGYGTDIFYLDDGSFMSYIGGFLNGFYNGFGKSTFSDGSFYIGEHLDGKVTGRGTFSTLTKDYKGYWKNFKLQGRGEIIYKDLGIEVIAEYVNGLEEGPAIGKYIDTGEQFSVVFESGIPKDWPDEINKNFFINKRVALVIGNNEYTYGKLNFAVNDSYAITDVLKDNSFEVLHITNATNDKFKKALKDFKELIYKFGPSTTALFYYSGHAAQIDGMNYLYPIDADIKSKSDIETETINIAKVFSILDQSLKGVKIVVLDACRDNPYSVFSKSVTKGLASPNSSAGTIIGYSTGPGKTSIDGGKGELSIYTSNLIEEIKKPGMDIEDVFKFTSRSVAAETNNIQIPWYSSSLLVDFYFEK